MQQRKIILYKEYFQQFLNEQDTDTQDKILQVLSWIQQLDIIPVSLMRSIQGYKGLFEIRVEYRSNVFRIFNCFDRGNIVVLFNAFQKKSQKTPQRELVQAHRLMEEYFKSKGGQSDGEQKK